MDGVQIPHPGLICTGHSIQQALHIGLDGGQRGAQIVGDPRQQLLAALLVPAGALHRGFQALGHLVEGGADRSEFVRLFVGDAVVQIALPDAAGPCGQKLQRALDPAEHEAGQKAVRQQDRANNGGQYQQGRQGHRQPESAAEMFSRGPQEADQDLMPVRVQAC